MVETLRLFYIMILFVSLYLVVVDGVSKLAQSCSEDFECYIKNPHAPFGQLRCFEGYCQRLDKPT
ncbi:putative Late nodulin [Medicago truncatula]|uniref:Nodule Cysteine-Rich (NCR) secreted peptide n=1 Tax=Medicago truncatula TaxID=3880 RepID=A7KHC5_MEDTR|nr:nodule-specific cysteine-rich peptide 237 [Medicago truncatula]KEH23045.1 Nodule Cysteine-Rich (NCR) secreted peptide [Medicago truncatula]RHN46264.1 putative Late nodulin [Medicago truncatula]